MTNEEELKAAYAELLKSCPGEIPNGFELFEIAWIMSRENTNEYRRIRREELLEYRNDKG